MRPGCNLVRPGCNPVHAPRLQPRACAQVLDIRDNDGVTELPPELVRDTPLQNLMVGLGLGFGLGVGVGVGPNPNPNP